MDGRTQEPVIKYLKNKYQADHVDMITEPGIVKLLADNNFGNIQEKINISVNKHGSKLIAIVAHDDCAGNPVNKEAQIEQLNKGQKLVSPRYPGIKVIKLWIDESWQAAEV